MMLICKTGYPIVKMTVPVGVSEFPGKVLMYKVAGIQAKLPRRKNLQLDNKPQPHDGNNQKDMLFQQYRGVRTRFYLLFGVEFFLNRFAVIFPPKQSTSKMKKRIPMSVRFMTF